MLLNIIMIAHNVTHGPFNEDARQGQVSQCVQHFCKTTKRASDSPLFMSFVERMIKAQGMEADKGMHDITDVLLQKFKDDNPFTCKGAKVNYNRFMGAIKKGTEVAPDWPARAFGLVLTVCEAGLMTEGKFKNMQLPEVATFAAGGGEGEASSSTADHRASAAEKMQSWKTENQLVVAALAMADEQVEIRHRALLAVYAPWWLGMGIRPLCSGTWMPPSSGSAVSCPASCWLPAPRAWLCWAILPA